MIKFTHTIRHRNTYRNLTHLVEATQLAASILLFTIFLIDRGSNIYGRVNHCQAGHSKHTDIIEKPRLKVWISNKNIKGRKMHYEKLF